MFEKILVCLDGSNLAEQIIPYALEEARRFQSRVILLHAVPEPVIVAPGIPGTAGVPVKTPGMPEQIKKEQAEATVYLKRIAEVFRGQDIKTSLVVLQGSAGDEIVSYAGENGIGLIAIATHGRSGLGRAVFGSVADYVLRESHLPILVIRPQEAS